MTAGYPYGGEPPTEVAVVDLPRARAVCGVHLGPVARIGESWQSLHQWVVENGYVPAGPRRERYLRAETEDQADWVTELQQPVTRDPNRGASGHGS